jgi:hypothetical protein
MSDELLEVKPEFMGFHKGEYQGAFPPAVEKRIKTLVSPPCLHLFSGSSRIGDCRVDLEHPNATVHDDVYHFIQEDNRNWAWVVLDPDYAVSRKHIKLSGHARTDSVSGNVLAQRLLEDYLRLHADNVLWFDICSPRPNGFDRVKLWVFLPGGYKSVRVLTWLKRKGERLA